MCLVHLQHRQIVSIIPVPGQFYQWDVIGFIEHCGMLKMPEVKLSHTSIRSYRSEYILILRKMHIVGLFVMGDQLVFSDTFLHIPDGAGGVDRGGYYCVKESRIPVEGSERGGELILLS